MIFTRLGTKFELDEEKILKEEKYNFDELYAYLVKIAQKTSMIKQDKCTYLCRGDENDLFHLGNLLIIILSSMKL